MIKLTYFDHGARVHTYKPIYRHGKHAVKREDPLLMPCHLFILFVIDKFYVHLRITVDELFRQKKPAFVSDSTPRLTSQPAIHDII